MVNLIENALRHGGPDVEVRTAVENGRAVVEVRDRGPGIPAAQAEEMLRPFTRMDAARSTPGTGLGLAIVDRIARLHGGEVKLLPREGGGLRRGSSCPSPRSRRTEGGRRKNEAQRRTRMKDCDVIRPDPCPIES